MQRTDGPFAAVAALQVEEAGLAGAAVALGHVGEALTLTGDLRAGGLTADGTGRRTGAR